MGDQGMLSNKLKVDTSTSFTLFRKHVVQIAIEIGHPLPIPFIIKKPSYKCEISNCLTL